MSTDFQALTIDAIKSWLTSHDVMLEPNKKYKKDDYVRLAREHEAKLSRAPAPAAASSHMDVDEGDAADPTLATVTDWLKGKSGNQMREWLNRDVADTSKLVAAGKPKSFYEDLVRRRLSPAEKRKPEAEAKSSTIKKRKSSVGASVPASAPVAAPSAPSSVGRKRQSVGGASARTPKARRKTQPSADADMDDVDPVAALDVNRVNFDEEDKGYGLPRESRASLASSPGIMNDFQSPVRGSSPQRTPPMPLQARASPRSIFPAQAPRSISPAVAHQLPMATPVRPTPQQPLRTRGPAAPVSSASDEEMSAPPSRLQSFVMAPQNLAAIAVLLVAIALLPRMLGSKVIFCDTDVTPTISNEAQSSIFDANGRVTTNCIVCPPNGDCKGGVLTCKGNYIQSDTRCVPSAEHQQKADELKSDMLHLLRKHHGDFVCGLNGVNRKFMDPKEFPALLGPKLTGISTADDSPLSTALENLRNDPDVEVEVEVDRPMFASRHPELTWACFFRLFLLDYWIPISIILLILVVVLLWKRRQAHIVAAREVTDNILDRLSRNRGETFAIPHLRPEYAVSDDIWEKAVEQVSEDPRISKTLSDIEGIPYKGWRWSSTTPYKQNALSPAAHNYYS